VLLVLPPGPFEQLFNGEDAVARVFLGLTLATRPAQAQGASRPAAVEASLRADQA